jgi:hypothetical protein
LVHASPSSHDTPSAIDVCAGAPPMQTSSVHAFPSSTGTHPPELELELELELAVTPVVQVAVPVIETWARAASHALG